MCQIFDLVAVFAAGLERDLPVPPEGIEAVDTRRAQVHFQRLIDVRQGHAQGLDFVPIDLEQKLWRVRAKVGDDVVQPRLLGQLRGQRFRLLLQGLEADAGAVFDNQFEAAGLTEAWNRRCSVHGHLGLRDLPVPGALELIDGLPGGTCRLLNVRSGNLVRGTCCAPKRLDLCIEHLLQTVGIRQLLLSGPAAHRIV